MLQWFSPAVNKGDDEDAWALVLSETTDPEVRLRLLAFRVSVLTREKEDLDKRMEQLETAYTLGRGLFWIFSFLGGIFTFFWANWGWITRPWGKTP